MDSALLYYGDVNVKLLIKTPVISKAISQKEADTKMILHALDATANSATMVDIHSPDTDVFVLSLRRYPELSPNTTFLVGLAKDTKR